MGFDINRIKHYLKFTEEEGVLELVFEDYTILDDKTCFYLLETDTRDIVVESNFSDVFENKIVEYFLV